MLNHHSTALQPNTAVLQSAGLPAVARWLIGNLTLMHGMFACSAHLPAAPPLDPSSYSESTLPSSYYISPSDRQLTSSAQPPTTFELPSESQLPEDQSRTPTTPTLPSESQLPAIDAQPQQPQQQPETLQDILATSRDRTPWLRLIEAEHTAPIRTVEIDASGNNLFTAGEDKIVQHWKLAGAGLQPQWRHHASYRWQVQRAERGTILSLISDGDELLIAGAGADGQQGEIVALNTLTGAWLAPLVDPQRGPHAPILKMRLLSNVPQRRVVSLDHRHGVGLWTQDPNLGTWSFRALRQPSVDQQFQFAPIDVQSPQTVVLASQGNSWTIDFIDIDSGAVTRQLRPTAALANQQALTRAVQLAQEHYRSTDGKQYSLAELTPLIRDNHGALVTSLAVDTTGQMVAAGDNFGFLYIWNSDGQLVLKTVASFVDSRFHALTFSRDGRYLAAVVRGSQTDSSTVQIWRLKPDQTPELIREIHRATKIEEPTFSAIGTSLILGNGRQIEVLSTEQNSEPQAIPAQASIALPSRVVFADELPYRWKFTLDTSQVAFDGQEIKWMETPAATWQTTTDPTRQFAQAAWTVVAQPNTPFAFGETWVMRGDQRIGRLDLQQHHQLRPESQVQHVAWINDTRGEVKGLAVWLSQQNDIWVFALPEAEQQLCPLIRVFRGHEASVNSLDCSPDSRYIISSSQDCTVRLWPLIGLAELGAEAKEETEPGASSTRSRWGFNFTVMEESVTATQPVLTGPLYLKGLRAGDQLREVSYEQYQPDGTLRRTSLRDPQEIIAFLQEPRFDLLVRFIFTRRGVEVPGFQSHPHWREIAAQVIAANREWALWTPAGFYDASFNGNSLFGWQINRGLEQKPDFYRADRFQATLERPNFIRRLLTAGSIEQAAELAGNPRIGFGDVLQNSLALQPQVKILSPTADQTLTGRQTTIQAEVIVDYGQELSSVKAFVSGVVANGRREVKRETLADGRQRLLFSWQAHLPADQQLQFQVLCATREKLVGADSLRLFRQDKPPVQPGQLHGKPKLYLLAAGISRYRDSRIPSLELGAANAQGFMQTLLDSANAVYDVVPLTLTDSSVTPAVWRSTAEQFDAKLREAGPDDLIVLFLSGHGLIDSATGEYFFVTADARYSDLVRHNYRDCLSFQELMRWVDIPCRKVAILDTCHSGAIQPLAGQHLKAAVRALQNDLVLTLTASEGDQLAAEYRGAQASLFTGAIQQTLRQCPDINGDGLLDWRELVQQVRRQVSAQSLAGAIPQFPTAGPKDLLEVIELPLALSHDDGRATHPIEYQPPSYELD